MALACQGGGSHTAFTAGVLDRFFDSETFDDVDVVGISGTSGGAVCALLAWNALVHHDRAEVGRRLEDFWMDNAAKGPAGAVLNTLVLWAAELQNYGLMPSVSPYHTPLSNIGAHQFLRLLRQHVDFEQLEADTDGIHPLLLLGAVDVLSGSFRAFNSRRDRITAESVLASAAIPNLFRSVRVGDGVFWDGLFSQNPPVHDLLATEPDELWVIQINPRERAAEPSTLEEIADRRNELAGNLSLYQELAFIETIDELLESGQLQAGGTYRQIVVRVVEMSPSSLPGRLGATSKLNRDPGFLRRLIAHGRQQADEFLAALAFEDAWRSGDLEPIMARFADEATLVVEAPFTGQGTHTGSAAIRRFVGERLAADVRLDLNHKQVARERVTWSVRVRREGLDDLHGRAEATLVDGRVTVLRLGARPAAD